MKINEIFYSLQGEGHWAGTPAIFVRFSGCNLKCNFCDTSHETGSGYSVDHLIDELRHFPAKRVILTGGEPALQVNDELITALHMNGYKVHIETNGTLQLPEKIDWVTCSPKDSGIKVTKINELKVVVGEGALNFEALPEYRKIPADEYYIQPCDSGNEQKNCQTLCKCIDYILANPFWRLSLQTHKIINIR